MSHQTRIVGTNSSELTSHAEEFYKDYWHVGEEISETSDLRNEALIKALFPSRPHGRRILEIGVGGEGGLLLRLREGNEIVGLDASTSGVEGSTRLGVPVQLFDADREAIPFPDDYFDIVLSFEVIEHLSNPQFAIDEVRRVLKSSGRFVASTPSPYIHHWPRFFYPSLVAPEGFRHFLLANRFWLAQEFVFGANFYAPILTEARDRAWSNIWVCDNAKGDAGHLVNAGRYFLEARDDYGVRMYPMEAADLLHAAIALDPHHIEALGGLAVALVYRVICGELAEFNGIVQKLEDAVSSGNQGVVIAAYFRLVLVHIEMLRFGKTLLTEDRCTMMISAVFSTDRSAGELLSRALQESRALAAKIMGVQK